jgi:hypothetical protein
MTIRGGGDPAAPHGFQTALKNGPAALELRRDAHDCIMVAILSDELDRTGFSGGYFR